MARTKLTAKKSEPIKQSQSRGKGKGKGKVKTIPKLTSSSITTKKPRRYRPGTLALKEIRKY